MILSKVDQPGILGKRSFRSLSFFLQLSNRNLFCYYSRSYITYLYIYIP